MPNQRTLSQWIAAGAVVPVALFTFGHVHGQSRPQGNTGAEAVFQGRPAMSGAQGGTGAMAGPPQGGVAPQSTSQQGGGVVLQPPAAVRERDQAVPRQGEQAIPRQGEQPIPRDPGMDTPPTKGDAVPRRDRDSGDVIKRDRENTGSTESTGKKVKKSAKRTYERSKHGGVPGIE